MFLVVAYDMVSDRRRNRLVNVLKNYGIRVNYSVFECELKKEAFQELKDQVLQVINKKQDIVLFYELCQSCRGKKEVFGRKKYVKNDDDLFFI